MSSRASPHQKALLDKLVREDEVLTWSSRSKFSMRDEISEHWERAAEQLNKLGPVKTGERWRLSWSRLNKQRARKKKYCTTDVTSARDAESHPSSSHNEEQKVKKPQGKKGNAAHARRFSVVRRTVKYGDENTCRKIIREVSIGILYKNKTDVEVLEELKYTMGQDFMEQWTRRRLLTLNKLNHLLAVNDCEMQLEPENVMTVTEWLYFDTVLVHQNCDVIGMSDVTPNDRKCLVDLYNLVDKFNIESLVGNQLAEGWVAVTMNYNKQNHHCTPMLLQRRWYQLKLATQTRFYKYWSVYKGYPERLKLASKYQPTVLQQTIAKQHRSLIVNPVKSWLVMIKENLVILREHFQLIAMSRAKTLPKDPTPAPENPWNKNVIVIGPKMNISEDRSPSPEHEIRNVAMKLEQDMDIDIEENPPRAPIIQNTPTLITSAENNEIPITETPVNIKVEFASEANDVPDNNIEIKEEINIEEHPPDVKPYDVGMNPTEATLANPDNVVVKQEDPDMFEISIDTLQTELPQITDVFGNVPIVDETQFNEIRKYMAAQMSRVNQMGVEVIADTNKIDVGIQGKTSASEVDETLNVNPLIRKYNFDTADHLNGVSFIDDWIKQPDDDSENSTDGDSTGDKTTANITAVDEKLLMVPVVYTVKLDDMDLLPIRLPKTITDKNLLESIHVKSKPTIKSKIAKKTEPQKNKVKIELKYTAQQLCNNPDFNIILKRFSPRFFCITRNRLLLRQCVPLTVDVGKEFEKRLVNGIIHLNQSDLDRRIDLPASSTQNVSIKPSRPVLVPSSSVVPIPAPVLPVPELSLTVPLPIVVPKIEPFGTIPIGPEPIALPSPITIPTLRPLNTKPISLVPTPIPLIPNPIDIAPTRIAVQNNKEFVIRSSVAPIILPTGLPNIQSNAIISNIHPPPLVPIQMTGSTKILVPINIDKITPTSTQTNVGVPNQSPSKMAYVIDEPPKIYTKPYCPRRAIKKSSFEFKVRNPKTLLTIESLDIMLDVLDNVQELQRNVVQVCCDNNNDVDNDDDSNIDDEELIKKKQVRAKSNIKTSLFCCWALERMNQIQQKNGAIYKPRNKPIHGCPYPRCNCCCKQKLAKYYNTIEEVSLSPVDDVDKMPDESPSDPILNENNSSIAQENKNPSKPFNVVFTLPTINKNTDKTAANTTNKDSVTSITTLGINPKDVQSLKCKTATATNKTILRKQNLIFLDDTKILLTTAKFPDNFETFEHFELKMKQNLHLPESVDIRLWPTGQMSVYKKRHAKISSTLLQELKDCVTLFHKRCGITISPDKTSLENAKTSKDTEINNESEARTGSILRKILASSKSKFNKDNKTTFGFIHNTKLRSKIKQRLGIILDKGLTPVQTLTQVKYACSVNGLFFKFNLKTSILTPLSISMKDSRSKVKDFVPLIAAPKTVTEFEHHIPEETITKLNIPNITHANIAPDGKIIRKGSSDDEPDVTEIQNTEKFRVGSDIKSLRSYNSILNSYIRKRTMKALRLVKELDQHVRKKQAARQKVKLEMDSSSESEEDPIDDRDSDEDIMQVDPDYVMQEEEDEVVVKEEIDIDENADPLKLDEEDF